jgi:hypothetical protein
LSQIAVIIVTRNNPFLLGHAISKYLEHPPGIACDFFIVDADSDDPRQLELLQKQKLGQVLKQSNDRVEVNFEQAWRSVGTYEHYFFCHDDNVPVTDDWMRPFLRRMRSNYCEPEVWMDQKDKPVGRVGALSQFWRGYTHVRNFPIQCPFLRPAARIVTFREPPDAFKYADCDRVLVSRKCLKATDGLVTIQSLTKHLPSLAPVFDSHLHYRDEGMYPVSKYPPGQYWNKLTLLSEFMNSLYPLMQGFRTVGVDSDGYLEQIHGEDVPWANRYVAHYGAPNSLMALAKHFGTDSKTVKSKLNDPVVLARAYRFFRDYNDSNPNIDS